MSLRIRQFPYFGYATWLQIAVISMGLSYFKNFGIHWIVFALLWTALLSSILAVTSKWPIQRILGGVALFYIMVSLSNYLFMH